MKSVLGVFGGSGIYAIPGIELLGEERIDTPFGSPSDALIRARLGETELLFLPRHGRGHRVPPHLINYRANIAAMKLAGASQIISLSAVGSMKEQIAPGHVVVVVQYIDLTKRRVSTFFEDGIAAHVSMADPVCPNLAKVCFEAAGRAGGTAHEGGSYVCIGGPQFSSRAESNVYCSWGGRVIGRSAMPEAKLAREAELPYATIALVTDYDCWHESEESVTVTAVLAVLRANSELAQRIVAEVAGSLPDPDKSPAARALEHAVITAPESIEPAARKRLGFLLERGSEKIA